MRILRVLPIAVGMIVAGLAAPASADSGRDSRAGSAYSDSNSKNAYRTRTELGASDVRKPQRTARRAKATRKASHRTTRKAQRTTRKAHRSARKTSRTTRSVRIRNGEGQRQRRASTRGVRVASLGNDVGYSSRGNGGGASHHGIASYYWQPQRVASGGWFNPNAMTAAHKTLPFGTRVRVTHLANGRSVVVRINDRGPYIRGRIIDLSKAAAGVIGMHGQGIARVRMDVLGR